MYIKILRIDYIVISSFHFQPQGHDDDPEASRGEIWSPVKAENSSGRHRNNHGKSAFFMGISAMSMALTSSL